MWDKPNSLIFFSFSYAIRKDSTPEEVPARDKTKIGEGKILTASKGQAVGSQFMAMYNVELKRKVETWEGKLIKVKLLRKENC